MLDKDSYVIVNIWTSDKNKALSGGANVGHISLETKHAYISLWPDKSSHKSLKTPSFFQPTEQLIRRYLGTRPSKFQPDYQTDCMLEGLSENGVRDISNINACQSGESPYLFDEETGDLTLVSIQPDSLKEGERLLAIPLHQANVRLVLYGLNEGNLRSEFKELKLNTKTWKLIGSNMLSRLSSESSENCSSLAFRCLSAGGMYSQLTFKNSKLKSQISSETSSIVTPDDLVRHVVAFKLKELKKYEETKDWKLSHVQESDIDELVKAYKDVGMNANIEEDSFSFKNCLLM